MQTTSSRNWLVYRHSSDDRNTCAVLCSHVHHASWHAACVHDAQATCVIVACMMTWCDLYNAHMHVCDDDDEKWCISAGVRPSAADNTYPNMFVNDFGESIPLLLNGTRCCICIAHTRTCTHIMSFCVYHGIRIACLNHVCVCVCVCVCRWLLWCNWLVSAGGRWQRCACVTQWWQCEANKQHSVATIDMELSDECEQVDCESEWGGGWHVNTIIVIFLHSHHWCSFNTCYCCAQTLAFCVLHHEW